MTQTEQQVFLDAAEKAFVTFQQCTPDFVFSEDLARKMAETLKANGLDPRKPEHLSLAWSKLRSAPAPAPVEPVDEVEKEARALIDSGHVSLESINEMSNNAYELASRNPVFCRAVEILTPKRETPPTLGDAALAANLNERLHQVAITQRAAYDVPPPTSGVRSSVQNNAKQIPIPKSFATQAHLDAAIRRDQADEALILEARAARMQRRRDIAHRRGKK